MQTVWEQTPQGVRIGYEDNIIRIQTDEALMDYLAQEGNGSLALAAYARSRYAALIGKPLDISEASISVEILVHAYLDAAAHGAERLAGKLPRRLAAQLRRKARALARHTEVIDIGEESVDTNRRFFDRLAPYRHLLYAVLGRGA